MSHSLRLSADAKQSIREQRLWYRSDERHGGAELAIRWTRELESSLEKLCQHPERHGLAPENGVWHAEVTVRQMLFRPWKSGAGWRVLYAVDESARSVTVLQVRHEHRPWLGKDD